MAPRRDRLPLLDKYSFVFENVWDDDDARDCFQQFLKQNVNEGKCEEQAREHQLTRTHARTLGNTRSKNIISYSLIIWLIDNFVFRSLSFAKR